MNNNIKFIICKAIVYRVLSMILNITIVYAWTKDLKTSLEISLLVEVCKFTLYSVYEYILSNF